MDLDDALAKIEAQFGRKMPTKEEATAKYIEKGVICVLCHKVSGYCNCDCSCKACWGQSKFNAEIVRQ